MRCKSTWHPMARSRADAPAGEVAHQVAECRLLIRRGGYGPSARIAAATLGPRLTDSASPEDRHHLYRKLLQLLRLVRCLQGKHDVPRTRPEISGHLFDDLG